MATLESIEAQLIALEDKIDALEQKVEAERSISRVCTTCGGAGHLDVYDSSPGNPGGSASQVSCPLCGGAEKIDWGVQEAL